MLEVRAGIINIIINSFFENTLQFTFRHSPMVLSQCTELNLGSLKTWDRSLGLILVIIDRWVRYAISYLAIMVMKKAIRALSL